MKKKKPQGEVTRMSVQGIISQPDAISNHQQLHISQCFVLQSSFSLGVKLHQIQSLLTESHTLFKNPIHLLVQLLRISLSHHCVKTLKLIVSREKIQFQVLENHLGWMTQMELIHFFYFQCSVSFILLKRFLVNFLSILLISIIFSVFYMSQNEQD